MRKFDACVLCLLGTGLVATARGEDPPLGEYFRAEVAKIAAKPLGGIESAQEWKERRPELRRQLFEMLGLWPLPEKTPLEARVTGTVERPDFVVEKLYFQSRPGLYVTANLYRPKKVDRPLPAILYVCGHSDVKKNGVIYGCKTHYQHHAAWYAANGYVCLVVDTLQLGELPGMHHGTFSKDQWWWQSRGYTPAGVEAWNGIRAIDYLVSRPEVDKTKIGVTGRSGGGATSWWLGALDDRPAAVVAVAGITDLKNHVDDGVVEGHCDCMYMVNSYRWDFPLVAALVAPKPLLVENTDRDPIFPKDGVLRIFDRLKKVYAWEGAADKLGLVLGKGGHVDSAEIRHPSFAFMNKWLKGKDEPIVEPDRSVPIEELKVLKIGEVPPGNLNDKIQETFVPKGPRPAVPVSERDRKLFRERWLRKIADRVFQGLPSESEAVPLVVETATDQTRGGIRVRALDYTSQTGVRLRLWLLTSTGSKSKRPAELRLTVVDSADWRKRWSWLDEDRLVESALSDARKDVDETTALAIVAPRGVGRSAWDPKKDRHIRRRFALIGQTLAGMQSYDILRAGEALSEAADLKEAKAVVRAEGDSVAPAFWAAAYKPDWNATALIDKLPAYPDGPPFPQLERVIDLTPEIAKALLPTARPAIEK